MRVANRLTAAMGSFFEIEGRDVNVRASVGVAAGRPGIETRRRPAAQRRRRDVFGQGARQGPGRRVRTLDARGGDGPRPAVGRPRARDLRPRVRPAVPADRRDRDGPDGRRRGARALGAPRARPDRPGRLHPGGRGVRFDPRDRPLGAEPACRQSARWHDLVTPGRSPSASTSRRGSSSSPISSRGAGDHRRGRRRAVADRARDDRDVDAPGQRHDTRPSSRTCGTPASASRSTISGPAIRRSATCSASRSRRSRSRATSSTSTASTPTRGSSRTRSWPSAGRSACR